VILDSLLVRYIRSYIRSWRWRLLLAQPSIHFSSYVSDYATLLSHLRQIQGTLDIRLAFVKDIVKESLRFKRRNLASILEEYLKNIEKTEDGCAINHKLNHNGATKISC